MTGIEVVAGVLMFVVVSLVGWWGVPIGAAGWKLVRPTTRPSVIALAAASAWGLILLWRATTSPVGALVTRLAAVFRVPGWLVVGATLAFAALAAWGTATLLGALRHSSPAPDRG